MNPIIIKRNSWHYKFILTMSSAYDLSDTCDYVNRFIFSCVISAARLTALFCILLMATTPIDFLTIWGFSGVSLQTMMETIDSQNGLLDTRFIFAVVLAFFSVSGVVVAAFVKGVPKLYEYIHERLHYEQTSEKSTSIFGLFYIRFKEKICKPIKITNN